MPRIVITSNIAKVIPGLKARKVRVRAAVATGAITIAAFANEELIPEFYPGKVAKSLGAFAEPYVTGGSQMAVRVRRLNRLFDFYEFGTVAHEEAGLNGPLSFVWEKDWRGLFPDPSAFDFVHNPGYAGRDKLPLLRAALFDEARDTWREAVTTAIQ